ncbi:MAG: hypothetical protein USCAAHI_03073 [Beijerinckiaceae bacterium]|nr:MAG: hypothetical protein USCAAHI_03073 [Beijerinckiaceae bacterium]
MPVASCPARSRCGHDVGWGEGGLLDLGEIVVGVAVQFHHAGLDQRVVAVRPHLGQVERVVRRLLGIGLRHDLNAETPARVVALLDRAQEIRLSRFAGLADDIRSLR